MHAAACDPGFLHPRGQSSELSHSRNKLIQRMEREVRAVIISGLWRGCCQTACTGGCRSCYLPPARMRADRRRVYSPRAGWEACMLISDCAMELVLLLAAVPEKPLRASHLGRTFEAAGCVCWGVWETAAGWGALLLRLLGWFSHEPSYRALLHSHRLLCTRIFLSPFDGRLVLLAASCL